MGRDVNDDRRRALVRGKFKFLYQDDTEDLEATDKFNLAVVQNKLLGPVKYVDKDGKDSEVLKIYGQERVEGEGVASPDVNIPGVLDLFTVVWSNPFGDLTVEQDIKLFEFSDIQKYSTYNDGPQSRDFCRFYTSSSSRELDGFDSSIFWSTGFLWKHFRTCGVEAWDLQLKELVSHYKNWRAWSHEVHNLPGSGAKKFSDNIYSGPGLASTSYSRRERENNNSSATRKNSTSSSPSHPPPPPPTKAVVAPPAGQTVVVPVTGQDGSVLHLQVSTLLPGKPQPQPRYKYINPSVPPPGYQDRESWSSQVEDFLARPRASKRKVEEDISPGVGRVKRTPVLPPSPSSRQENKLYRGDVLDWRGKFGFLSCGDIPGKIFVHSKDIMSGRKGVKAGTRLEFQVLHQDSSVVGPKAVNASVLS